MNKMQIIRVALIDDHDLLRDGIFKVLECFGFQILFEAENGQTALDEMQRGGLLPDVCIVDVNMPVMNGFETAKALRQHYPNVKILAFSVNDDERDVFKMLQNGANGYILKGADPGELRKAIEVVYNGGRYFSAGISDIAERYFTN
ncbi:response regulator [Elizabethkingia anophelis]|jgi:DNA-binding NarL/FixJ family response regulator|uniref:response regulator n=1 Tax=Elizabethkingia anophelis TaxID=1117645 RepID=UPI00293CE12B|nr:response regulator transcription factor [Elizabethkingia anophelis]MDV4070024.1 hypothetical protein [Elizabethkingia anophelis]